MDQCRFRPGRWLPVMLLLFAFPASAHAHTTIQGMGDFVSGLIHPLRTPAHVLLILGLGLLAGQQPPETLKTLLLAFVPLSAIALALTTTGWSTTVYPPVVIALALGAGALVALERPIPRAACAALFGAAALAIGFDSAVEAGSNAAVIKTLLGTWVSLVVLVFDLAIYAAFGLKKKWLQVGIRILGSWIVAISLLVLAFSLRRRQ